MAVTVNTTAGTSVTVSVSGSTQASFTTESTSVSVTSPASSSISVLSKGPKGDTGAEGPQGTQGAAGQGVPTGGLQFQVLRKSSGDDYDTAWDYADRVTLEVRFDEAVSKGDPLYITGFNNGQNRITVAKADAADSAKMPSIGLAFADYSQNDNGQATAIGSLDDVNTQVSPNDFQEGDVLYVKAGGGLTNVKPTGTNLIQNVGKVGRRQQNNGEIVVMAIGRSNDVPNIPNGQIWIGNASGVATPTAFGVDLDSSPQLGGNLDTNDNNINFGDADEAVFGAGSDLRIYHAGGAINHIFGVVGASTYITGGTDLYLRGVNGEEAVTINGNGSVELFHDNSKKLETTSTGLDVTGNIDVSGTVDGVDIDALNTTVSGKIGEVSDDTTPQLGGDLDVNGNKIVSASNGDIVIDPHGTGAIILKSDDVRTEGTGSVGVGVLKLYEGDVLGENFVALKAPLSIASDLNLTLPAADGSDGQVLKTNGSGTLSFTDALDGVNDTLTGITEIKDAGATRGTVSFYDDAGDNFVALRGATTLTSDTVFILPTGDGSANHYLKTDGSGNLSFDNPTAKFRQVHSMSFLDDINTTKHYLPWKDINEQTTIYQEEAAMLMPYDGRIISVTVRTASISGSGDLTIDVSTAPLGNNIFSGASWTQEETEVLSVTSTDDHHGFHFVFDNAQHFEAGDLCSIGIQASADLSSTSYWYVTTIVEFDTSADLGSSSTEHQQNP